MTSDGATAIARVFVFDDLIDVGLEGLSGQSVNVVVAPPEGGLQATDVTVIKDIVVAETGVTAGQIKIVEAS